VIRVVSAYCGRTRILDFDYLSLRSIPTTFCIPSLKKVMRKFAEKFHPGDSIGFAYGLHHETAHLHAHLALCSRTAKGRYVGCSASRYSRSKPKRQMALSSPGSGGRMRWEKILQSTEETDRAVRFAKRGRRLCSPRKPTPRFTLRRRASSCSVDPKGMDRDLVLIFAVFCPKISVLTVSPL
jgi:hypothetical protein